MKRYFFFLASTFLFCAPALAQVPHTLNYQGILTVEPDGIVPDDVYNLEFFLYDAETGGTPLWREKQALAVYSGLVNAVLGKSIPIDLPFDKPYWLAITINEGEELQPRITLTSAPYSFNAAALDNLEMVKSLNGETGQLTLQGDGATTIDVSNGVITIRTDTVYTNELATAGGIHDSTLYIDDFGNVGIGTNNPKHFLHVRRDTSFARALFAGKGGFIMGLGSATGQDDEKYFAIGSIADRMWLGAVNDRLNIISPAINFYRNRRVGIGAYGFDEPSSLLQIQHYGDEYDLETVGGFGYVSAAKVDSGDIRYWLRFDTQEIRTWDYYAFMDGTMPTLKLQSSRSFQTPGNVDMVNGTLYVKHDSTVGIGTRNPFANLHLRGDVDPTLLIQSNGTNELSGRVSLRQSNMTGADLYYDGTNSEDRFFIEMFDANGSRGKPVTINNNGNVGIQNTAPAAGLHVGSDMLVDGTINGADMPYAYGNTLAKSGSGNWTALQQTGGWDITIQGEDFDQGKWTLNVQPISPLPLIPVIGKTTSGGQEIMTVRLYGLDGKLNDAHISFILYKP